MSRIKKMYIVYDIISRYSDPGLGICIHISDILREAEELGIGRETVKRLIKFLKRRGEIYEMREYCFSTVVNEDEETPKILTRYV